MHLHSCSHLQFSIPLASTSASQLAIGNALWCLLSVITPLYYYISPNTANDLFTDHFGTTLSHSLMNTFFMQSPVHAFKRIDYKNRESFQPIVWLLIGVANCRFI